ncbi:50S ribosomal protein L10 [Candidatus Bathyarchaeota archaeon ex4484_135]|nr:MAG: 50S ribosomal protein L10 [Candidatus Bathyarchaeota archaeon ex4484_135]
MSTSMGRPVPEWKKKVVEEIKGYLKKYKYVLIADLYKVRAAQLQELRRALRGKALIKVLKNTLFSRAIDNLDGQKEGLQALKAYLRGQNIFIFTNENPFKMARTIDQFKVKVLPSPGDVATNDIVIPAGNTGLPPGPIISTFGSLGIPTKIESGSIWIVKDTVVAKKGDVISHELAYILSKLDLKVLELGITLKAAYVDGIVIPGEELKLDVEGTKKAISEAFLEALNLSLNIAYPTSENVPLLLQMAHIRALSVALAASYPTKDTISLLLAKAEAEANALARLLAEKGFS